MLRRITPVLLGGLVALGACTDQDPTAPSSRVADPSFAKVAAGSQYVVLLNNVPADFEARVAAAGGKVTWVSREAGLATVESDAPDFKAKLGKAPGVQAVARDTLVQWAPNERVVVGEEGGAFENALVSPIEERWFPILWNIRQIQAPEAWATGATGKGARVAILDGGIWDQHVDIQPNLDVARSRSFVPGVPFNADLGTFWHGTHVAGIVAAADNADNLGVIGVAPEATLIGVKVLHGGSGSFAWVIQGIIYAATPIEEGGAGAHIINMSLGATFNRVEKGFTSDNSHLINALSQATSYARKRGVLVVVSAGNGDEEGIGIDHDHTGSLMTVPAQSTGVLTVSALGPLGYALGADNFDRLASFSNYGNSLIDLSGPGGDFALPGEDPCVMAINAAPPSAPTTTVTQPCWVFDMVVSSCRGTGTANVCWAAGTSMSAPAVAGVAALIVGKYGPQHPAQLEQMLRKAADDLGKPGHDPIHGGGRVNAFKAVSR